MMVAFAALMIALGGSSYAAVKLAKNSVGTTHIKNNAVTGAKVKSNTLTGSDINEASLQGVISQKALRAAGIEKVTIKSAPFQLAIAPETPCPGTPAGSCFVPVTQFTNGSVNCDPGQVAIHGGVKADDFHLTHVVESYPTGGTGWSATFANDDPAKGHTFTVYALCVPGEAG